MLAVYFKVVAFCRRFPLTAPVVAAVDTVVATVTGNFKYAISEPLVVLAAIQAGVSVAVGAGWKAYVAAYLTAAARYFTTPRTDVR